MLELSIPGLGEYRLSHLVLDVNGTLACDGALLPEVAEKLGPIRDVLNVHLLSSDTHGRLDAIAQQLGVPASRVRMGQPEAEQKAAFVRQLNASSVVAIGNGANDVGMLKEAAIGIIILGPEGLAVDALTASDVAVGSIADALDLLIHPKRLTATLRR